MKDRDFTTELPGYEIFDPEEEAAIQLEVERIAAEFPRYSLADIRKDLGVSQAELAIRMETTKEKIAERYLVLRRQKRIGKERKCKGCQKSLSIYNDDPLCVECFVNPVIVLKTLKKIKGLGNNEE